MPTLRGILAPWLTEYWHHDGTEATHDMRAARDVARGGYVMCGLRFNGESSKAFFCFYGNSSAACRPYLNSVCASSIR